MKKTDQIVVRLTPEEKAELQDLAKRNNKTVSKLIVEQFVGKNVITNVAKSVDKHANCNYCGLDPFECNCL